MLDRIVRTAGILALAHQRSTKDDKEVSDLNMSLDCGSQIQISLKYQYIQHILPISTPHLTIYP